MSFLPPTPIPAPGDAPLAEPPHVAPPLYTTETPNLTPRTSPEVDRRLKAADEHFEAGKEAYRQENPAVARQEFDRALDVLLSAPEDLPERARLERRLDQMVDSIYRFDLDQLGAGNAKQAIVYDKSPLDSMLEMTFPIDPKLKPKVTEEITATTSQLPLEENDTVLSYIHYFSTERGRKVLLSGLRRAGRYRPLIQRILDEEGVPQELICLAQAESGFLPRAVSYKSATGMWQFVAFRGKQYGLEQTPNCDERFDPEKSTRAAARHLRDLYANFGDWYLAMAAYNCGPGCVDRAVQRTGYADFWELANRNALPKQTINYVPLILAITIMTKNPKDYGLEDIDVDRPIEYDTVAVSSATSVELIADAVDRPVSEIRDLNPALLKYLAPAGYQLHIPKGSAPAYRAAIDSIPENKRASWRMHRVEAGETLAGIAKHYGAVPELIAQANHRTVEAPEAGDLLVIPTSTEPRRAEVAVRHHAKTSAAVRKPVAGRTANAQVASKVLHRRAAPRTVKTASVLSSSNAQ